MPRYRCHVGHAYAGDLLLAAQSEVIERALWSALRAHEERQMLLGRLAVQARAGARSATAGRWEQAAAEHEEHARAIRRLLGGEPASARAADGEAASDEIEARIA